MSREAHILMAEIHAPRERRANLSAERQLDVVAAQNFRKFVAIREAVEHLRDINRLKGDRTLKEIADKLEKANQVRQDDEG